jgi:ABC-type sulfate transport system permease component
VGLVRMPALRDALARARSLDARSQIEVAQTLGASRWEAWRATSASGMAAILGGAMAWSVAMAALDSGPALLLAPNLAARPIVPGVLTIAGEPGGMRRASAMAVVAMLLPVAAWIVGGSREAGPKGRGG